MLQSHHLCRLRLVPGITNHLVDRKETPSCSWICSSFRERNCERFRCRARQQTAPPSLRRHLGARLEDFRRGLCLVLCHDTARRLALHLGPSSAHFSCNDHQPGFSTHPTQFWEPVFLALASVLRNPLHLKNVSLPHRRSVSMVCTTPTMGPPPKRTNLLQSHPTCANHCCPFTKSRFRTIRLVDTLAPPARQIWATTLSTT